MNNLVRIPNYRFMLTLVNGETHELMGVDFQIIDGALVFYRNVYQKTPGGAEPWLSIRIGAWARGQWQTITRSDQ